MKMNGDALFSLIYEATQIDTQDLNYAYTSPKMDLFLTPGTASSPEKGYLVRITSFLYHLIKSNLKLPFQTSTRYKTGATLFFADSKNQQSTLSPLCEIADNFIFLGINGFGQNQFPLGLAYLISLPFFPIVIYRYLKLPREQKSKYQYSLDLHWLAYGYYILWRLFLKKNKPLSIVISNDHFLWCRTIISAAKITNIKTIYLQHASVSENFPPLSVDYALLEGKDSLHKYDRAGNSSTIVFLIGIPKADQYLMSNNSNSLITNIGVCVSNYDNIPPVDRLLQEIVPCFSSVHFILRAHPADKRKEEWIKLAKSHKISISDAKEESSFEYLMNIDLVIASESNIHLEAALLNTYPVYYKMGEEIIDNYHFLQNGLLSECFLTPNEIISWLKINNLKKPDSHPRAAFYNASIGTSFEGKSAGLAIQLINEIGTNSINLERWDKIEGTKNLQAFQLRNIGTV